MKDGFYDTQGWLEARINLMRRLPAIRPVQTIRLS
jgi:hypothetical protein